jgi:hypothetical protein
VLDTRRSFSCWFWPAQEPAKDAVAAKSATTLRRQYEYQKQVSHKPQQQIAADNTGAVEEAKQSCDNEKNPSPKDENCWHGLENTPFSVERSQTFENLPPGQELH